MLSFQKYRLGIWDVGYRGQKHRIQDPDSQHCSLDARENKTEKDRKNIKLIVYLTKAKSRYKITFLALFVGRRTRSSRCATGVASFSDQLNTKY